MIQKRKEINKSFALGRNNSKTFKAVDWNDDDELQRVTWAKWSLAAVAMSHLSDLGLKMISRCSGDGVLTCCSAPVSSDASCARSQCSRAEQHDLPRPFETTAPRDSSPCASGRCAWSSQTLALDVLRLKTPSTSQALSQSREDQCRRAKLTLSSAWPSAAAEIFHVLFVFLHKPASQNPQFCRQEAMLSHPL